LNGYYGDSAITVAWRGFPEAPPLMEVTRESLELAIDKCRPGNRLFDICGTWSGM
jgi:methionine aminopeptidase